MRMPFTTGFTFVLYSASLYVGHLHLSSLKSNVEMVTIFAAQNNDSGYDDM